MKVGVGISGGVDSAVAALLLQERGYEVFGYTMSLGRADEELSLNEAREAAARLGIGLTVCDFSSCWRAKVIDDLREVALSGRTPNPCVRCNETVKLGLLPERAFADGCDFFATGHYARTAADTTGEARLMRAADHAKDQSYFLYRVGRRVLSRLILPLGGMTKAEVRERARAAGFEAAHRGDSQDFCGGDPLAVIGADDREGDIVDIGGKVLARHRGFWRYTVGQRKGLGIGGGTPYYVVRLDARRNEVVVAFREHAEVREFGFSQAVWLRPEQEIRAVSQDGGLTVKVRSAGDPKGPVMLEGDRCICPEGILGVAPGQSAVFYRGGEVLGGGVIV